jgi:ubiquinone/menaquinone biosynthesis C-methylase UbiE
MFPLGFKPGGIFYDRKSPVHSHKTMNQRPTEATKHFFDQWQLYQQIIEQDYMAHRGIHQALKQLIDQQFNTPFNLVDLGCGDAQAIAKTLANTQITTYTGLDLSPNALTLATKNLKNIAKIDLICDDFLNYLQAKITTHEENFDIIHIGFALHHLLLTEKQQFFQYCRALIAKTGYLLIYDIFRKPDQSRDYYIQAYLANVQSHWTTLSPEQLQSLTGHIKACDFPESLAIISEIAQTAGFSAPLSLFVDASGFHQLLAFSIDQ